MTEIPCIKWVQQILGKIKWNDQDNGLRERVPELIPARCGCFLGEPNLFRGDLYNQQTLIFHPNQTEKLSFLIVMHSVFIQGQPIWEQIM